MHCLYAGDMRKTSISLRHLARPGAFDGQSGARRRLLAVPLVGCLTAIALLLGPVARERRHLIDAHGRRHQRRERLRPDPERDPARSSHKEFPQFTFKYVGSATGARDPERRERHRRPERADRARCVAREPVRRGRLLVQQPVRERDLHQRLRARRDRPATPPAWRRTPPTTSRRRSPTSRPPARTGTATFFTRGGTTTASGTTVEEHEIWALVNSSGLQAGEPDAVHRERGRRRRACRRSTRPRGVANGGSRAPTAAP